MEALRLGVPVVTTPVGAEGIGIQPGRDAIVAEGVDALAEAVLELLGDPERCAALSAAGAALVDRRFSRTAARTVIGEVFHTPRCGICGSGRLIAPPAENFREAFVCHNCFALGRAEALGRVLVHRLARGGESSVAELARRRSDLRIHEFGFVGGLVDTLRGQSWFTVSDYFDGVPPGTVGPVGVRCENLTQLTFADDSFDLGISQDVMEHVPDPTRGFAEAARVLRPGGSHIFTISQNPNRPFSVTRARLEAGKVQHVLPPEYHGDPVRAEGALVFTDFGADLKAMLEKLGLHLIEHDLPVLGGTSQETVRVFEAVKPVDSGLSAGVGRASGLPGSYTARKPAMRIDAVDLIERGQPVAFDFRGETFVARSHRDSGYVFFTPPPDDVLDDYYQNEYQRASTEYYTVDTDYERGKNVYHASRMLKAYSAVSGKLPRSSFELGCAYGGLVAEMARRGIDARGSDINRNAIAIGRQEKANSNIVRSSNLAAYSHVPNPVDLLYSLHVLEHDPHLVDVVRHACSALSQDGMVFISIPNAMYVSGILKGFAHHPWANYPQHLHMLSPGFLPALCEETGFVPLHWDTGLFFGTDPALTGIFSRERMSDDVADRLAFILGQGGFGMELNFLLAPKGSRSALRHAEIAAACLASLEVQRQNEVAVRTFLRSPL